MLVLFDFIGLNRQHKTYTTKQTERSNSVEHNVRRQVDESKNTSSLENAENGSNNLG